MIKNRYVDLIEQTFYFPRHGFNLAGNELTFHDIPLMEVIKEFGTPLKFFYLPKITSQIEKARKLFNKSIEARGYQGAYHYCYCTKSSHFSFVLERAVASGIGLETSSAFDLDIIERLTERGSFDKQRPVICNGYKTPAYFRRINRLADKGYNIIPILDNPDEIKDYKAEGHPISIGIRIATEEEPSFSYYTSRLGISSKNMAELYLKHIHGRKDIRLKMLHFFVNTGIRDTTYFWSELTRLVGVYCEMAKLCPDLDSLDIGGGMPIYTTLGVEHDYEYMIDQIVMVIKEICDEQGVKVPDIYSEFGSFTVGESAATIYSVIGQKQQNDKELWYMIDSSFITTLPDTWGIGQKFILLAINHWDRPFQRINFGGLTCDSQDFYNSDTHTNQVFMPVVKPDESLYVGFFHTGAYQESVGGYGGVQHCLIPGPKTLLIDRDEAGNLKYEIFRQEQSAESMLKLLGY